MNLPNRLTLIRIAIVPVMVGLYLIPTIPGPTKLMILGILFVFASFTDFLDGYLARKYNMVTTLGKFMDPLADKLLVISSLLLLMDYSHQTPYLPMPFYVVLIVIARELIVTSIRLVAVNEGKIIAASWLGKIKTFTTMIAIIYYFFLMETTIFFLQVVAIGLTTVFTALTIYSGVDYFWQNRHAILRSK